MSADQTPLGVYVHIPFCAHRCDYCDFATWTDRGAVIDEYVDACVRQIRHEFAHRDELATTVFFGGGTPSLLAPARLVAILEAIPREHDAEVTIECNPDLVDPEKFAAYRDAGATRISIGMQSASVHVLASLGRTHTPANVERAVANARAAGFEHVNVDLIYGAAGESIADWRTSVEAAIALPVDHVSAYALTVEPATPLGKLIAAGERAAPDDDDQAEKYFIADELLTGAGFASYEISNWARPGGECRHNLDTWHQADYLAIGCAAHGHEHGRRYWNVRTPERYVERIAAGESPVAGEETLPPAGQLEERFALGLRTSDGAFVAASPRVVEIVEVLDAGGLLTAEAAQPDPDSGEARLSIRLTTAGSLVATDLTARLILAGAAKAAPDFGTDAGPGAGTR